MNKLLLRNIARFIILVLIQVLVFNNMNLGGYLHPYVYVLFLLLLPLNTNKVLLLIIGFATGISIDYFAGTLGLNASASVFLMYLRPGTIRLFFGNQEFMAKDEPGFSTFGIVGFLKYAVVLVFAHQLVLFYLEVFSFNEFLFTLSKVVLSTGLTIFIILITMFLISKPKKKR